MKTFILMENITKSKLKLVGSADSLESLSQLVRKKMLWMEARFELSQTRTVGKKPCYDVYNAKGLLERMVVYEDKGRYKFCRIF